MLDDETELCELCAEWLVAAGTHKVFTADEAKDALAMLLSESIDLLLTDVRMPGMDGLDLVRELAEIGKTLPAFFLSGFEGIDPREMYSLGVEALLRKPVEQEFLLEVSKTALAERSSLWLTEMDDCAKTVGPHQGHAPRQDRRNRYRLPGSRRLQYQSHRIA